MSQGFAKKGAAGPVTMLGGVLLAAGAPLIWIATSSSKARKAKAGKGAGRKAAKLSDFHGLNLPVVLSFLPTGAGVQKIGRAPDQQEQVSQEKRNRAVIKQRPDPCEPAGKRRHLWLAIPFL